jgi:prolyl oligopeptidase
LLLVLGFCSLMTNVAVLTPPATAQSTEQHGLKYPSTRRGDQVDDYHGTQIADPYRWLEDPDSPESRVWITAENTLTESYLAEIKAREPMRRRLTKLWDYEKFGVPSHRAGRYLFSHNDGLQNQSVLFVADRIDAEPRELLDPNRLSTDGTVSLTGYTLSDDGRRLAYGIARAGSDWQEWHVREVDGARDLEDVIRWVKFSGASWSHTGEGFFYSRYDEPAAEAELTGVNYYQKLYYHRLGTPQSADRLVYERRDEKEWGFYGHVTDDGRYLIITVTHGTERKNQVFYLDLERASAPVVELLRGFDASYDFVGNDGPLFWFRTDFDAPRYRLIAIDTGAPERRLWRELIAESSDVLESVSVAGERFFATYLQDASSRVRRFHLDGKPDMLGGSNEVKLPGLGTVVGFDGRRGDRETFYAFTSFTTPTTIYRYEVETGESTVFRKPKVDFRSDDYETKQVFYTSKDGTRVPMFIVHRRGLKLDGQNPTLLYGYGGFNIPLTPSFDVRRVAWLELGGVYAMPNLRGGGEYGRAWHEAGMRERKQNVFDDFIAAAEYLIQERYTSSDKLAISGRSNGGLLVGACLTQRPDLFRAALPAVGVLDMLRFQRFTIGWAWVSEFGSAEVPADFPTLRAYSPLHNIKLGTHYPAVLVETGDHDDRVVPAHSFKFAAALQAAQAGDRPVLIRIETSAGHGAGTPTSKLIDATTDSYAFLVRELGIKLPDGYGQ